MVALVLRTGFGSLKGQLVRTMIYPAPRPDLFVKRAVIFLCYYGVIIIFSSIFLFKFMLEKDFPEDLVAIRVFTVLLWILPPALPLYFAFGQGMSSHRLYRKGIIALDYNKFSQAGDVDLCCFDKTGTIT